MWQIRCGSVVKMTKKPKKKTRYVSDFEDSAEICNAGSAGECTGLIPFMTDDEDMYEIYSDIYAFGAWCRDNF